MTSIKKPCWVGREGGARSGNEIAIVHRTDCEGPDDSEEISFQELYPSGPRGEPGKTWTREQIVHLNEAPGIPYTSYISLWIRFRVFHEPKWIREINISMYVW